MLIFTKKDELRAHLTEQKRRGKTLGFVPTMGALHAGHISLISASKNECNTTICSIFVNPTQFNDKADLEKYPRMPEKDTEMLKNAHCDVLFLPTVEEMYNDEKAPVFTFGYLDKILEGEHRPGHFNGVAQVVKRFFEIIEPHKAYFGSKDYQQVMIVKALVKQMNSTVQIVPCPILREPDGLAMSSRNALLNAEERMVAGYLPEIMSATKKLALSSSITAAKMFLAAELQKMPGIRLEYYEICDADTLLPIASISPDKSCISLIAAFVGKIRLIDNLILN
ncbi:MAG: pantoate--beta-alanine ligase [bacterium]|nr:pantoate--beta-alanine ligase [bacterium]